MNEEAAAARIGQPALAVRLVQREEPDAMHTQTDTARYVVEVKQADYLFIVKDNQPTLRQDIADLVPKSWPLCAILLFPCFAWPGLAISRLRFATALVETTPMSCGSLGCDFDVTLTFKAFINVT